MNDFLDDSFIKIANKKYDKVQKQQDLYLMANQLGLTKPTPVIHVAPMQCDMEVEIKINFIEWLKMLVLVFVGFFGSMFLLYCLLAVRGL